MLSQHVIDSLFPPELPEPGHWENRYPPGTCPPGPKSPGSRRARPATCTSAACTRRPSTWPWPGRPAACSWSGWRTPTRPGSPRAPPSSSPRRSPTSPSARPRTTPPAGTARTTSPRGRRPTSPTSANCCARAGPTLLRDQAGPGGDHRPAAGGRRPARLLREVGHLAGRRSGTGHRAAGGRRPLRGAVPVPGADRDQGDLHRRDPRRADPGRQQERRGDPQEQRRRAAAADLPFRARRRRPPDADQPGHPGRGVDLLGAAAPAAVRCPRLRAGHLRAHRPADEAGRRQPPQAVQAEGSRGHRQLLHRAGLPRPGRAVLPARPGQRPAGRDAAGRGAGRADQAVRVRHRGPAGRHGQARRHLRRLRRHPDRRADPGRGDRLGAPLRRPTWPPSSKPSSRWRCAPWPSSARDPPTRARTCGSGRTSAPSTATSSPSCSPR